MTDATIYLLRKRIAREDRWRRRIYAAITFALAGFWIAVGYAAWWLL